MRPRLVQSRRGRRALRGRPGGDRRRRDRRPGAGGAQADPHRMGGPAAGPESRRGHATRRLPTASPQRRTTSPTPIISARAMPRPPCGRRTWWSKASIRRRSRSTPISSPRPAWPTSTTQAASRSRPPGQWTHVDREQIAHSLGLARRAGAGDLPGHRRRVRRARGHVRADHPGAGRLAPGPARHPPADQDHLEPGRIDHRPRQAPRHEALGALRRPAGRQAGGGAGQGHRRRRRVLLHQQQGAGQLHADLHRAVRDPQRQRSIRTPSTPTTCPARPSAASAGRRATSQPRARWTSWPRRWAWTRSSCA